MVMDPKCDWAIGHLEYFPIEVNRADYKMLFESAGHWCAVGGQYM